MMNAPWTIEELVERANRVLEQDPTLPPNRRVSERLSPRIVRLYTTLGLLSRPVLRGRTGFYGPEHLMQLIAVKRLQSEGYSLVEIQNLLLGAELGDISRIARVPEEMLSGNGQEVAARHCSRRRTRFWQASPVAEDSALAVLPPEPTKVTSTATWTVIPLDEAVQLLITTGVDIDADTMRELAEAAAPLRRVVAKILRTSRRDDTR